MRKKSDKLFAVVLSLVITLTITIATVVGVLSAGVQNINSSMSVSYHANNVSATMRASYQVAGSNGTTSLVNTANNTNYLKFYANQNTTTGLLNAGNIILTSSTPYVLFTFAFTNNATRDTVNNKQGYDIRITLRDNSVRNNVTAKYMTDTTLHNSTLAEEYENMSSASTELPSAVYVGAQRTVYFYLLLEITNLDYGAQYASYSNAGVSWTLDHVDYLDGDWVNYGWTINQNNVVTAYNGTDTDIEIPSTATAINSSLFRGNTSITSVIIPNTITSVGRGAFYNCTNLESVIFESGGNIDTNIGVDSFRDCKKLSTLTFSNNVTSINDRAFYGCTRIISMQIPDSVTYIGALAFYCTGIEGDLLISSNVTYIGYGAFSGCSKLTAIIVDESNSKYCSQNNCIIRKSDKMLVLGCKNSVIPNDVTSILDYAFLGMGLTTVTIPNTVIVIGNYAFHNSALTLITIPDSVTEIGHYAFYNTKITSINIPSSVKSIGTNAFQYCYYLTSVYFEHTNIKTITTMGSLAFKNLKSGVAFYFKDTEENVASWGKFTTDYFHNTTYHSY